MKRINTLVATNGVPTEILIDAQIFARADTTLQEQADIFAREAVSVEAALFEAMPGGLYDRLLGAMLARKASHLIVSHQWAVARDRS